MFKILIVSLAITYCNAGNIAGPALDATGYGLGYGANYGYAGGLGLATGLGYATGLGKGYASGPIGPVSAAIQSKRTYEVVPSPLYQEPAVPQIIEVHPSIQPVQVIFRSISSPVQVQQIHTPGAPGQVESTNSEDQPHRVTHEVLRPVIQEVREVIQPYRRVVQEVRPVLEEVHTVVAKGQRENAVIAPAPAVVAAPVAAPIIAAPVEAPVLAAPVAAPVIADAGYAGGYGLIGGYGLAGGYGKAGKAFYGKGAKSA
jgi:hypothetical protein